MVYSQTDDRMQHVLLYKVINLLSVQFCHMCSDVRAMKRTVRLMLVAIPLSLSSRKLLLARCFPFLLCEEALPVLEDMGESLSLEPFMCLASLRLFIQCQ